MTKSPLITRDIELIGALAAKEVGITVTTTDDSVGRYMEAHAPSASERLRTLARLNSAGIPTYAFVGPLLPHYRFQGPLLEELFRRLKDAGTTTIFAEHLNTSPYILRRMEPVLRHATPELKSAYEIARGEEHRRAVTDLVLCLVEKFGFALRLGRVLDHKAENGSRASGPTTM